MKIFQLICMLFLAIFWSCKNTTNTKINLEDVFAKIKSIHAPDKRVELFDIQFNSKNGNLILSGETTSKKAFSLLLDTLKNVNSKFTNNVRFLPDSAVGNLKYAVAKNSVINIRSKPKHSAELGTQGLLGMPLKVLDKKGDFYRIQTPDNYISWVDKGGIVRMNLQDFMSWNNAKKVIFTQNFGYVYTDTSINSTIVSDISLGGILQYIAEDGIFYKVKYPDNRIGFIKKTEASLYDFWLENNTVSKENIEAIAKKMMGFPYLWGGTSAKGVDCSGFTKMVYFLNGFIIPRDASQQITAGKTVDKNLTFDGLEKGDLLFFGKKATPEKKQRITHVGIWLGNNKQEFIHASGNVHLGSMDENQINFDSFNKNRYLGAKRYLGVKDKLIVDLNAKTK